MSKPMAPNDGTMCPMWRKACSKVCHTCAWWTLVQGKNPQTGLDTNQWGCAMAWPPILVIESNMVQRQTTATVQELRNDVARSNDVSMVGAISKLNDRLHQSDFLPHDQVKLLG